MNIIETLNSELVKLRETFTNEVEYNGLKFGDVVIPMKDERPYDRFQRVCYFLMCETFGDDEKCVWVWCTERQQVEAVNVMGSVQVHLF